MKRNKALFLTQASLVAALYVILTLLSNMFGLGSGAFQVRLSEALSILPVFTFAAVPGLFCGCLISNFLTGAVIWDIIFGSLATLLGALGTHLLRDRRLLALTSPIIANTFIIPFVLTYAYGIEGTVPLFMLTVGIGEMLSAGVLGYILMQALERYGKGIHW